MPLLFLLSLKEKPKQISHSFSQFSSQEEEEEEKNSNETIVGAYFLRWNFLFLSFFRFFPILMWCVRARAYTRTH